MVEKVNCDICGSDKVREKILKQSYQEPYGSIEEVEELYYECDDCKTVWEDINLNQKKSEIAIDKSRKEAIKNIINNLNNQGYNLSFIERALKLPQRTLTKWKSSDSLPGAGSYALMNIIRTYSWILNVADHNYDQNFASRELVKNGAKVLFNGISQNFPELNDYFVKSFADKINFSDTGFSVQNQKEKVVIERF